jgi:hypothetical protein
VDSEITSPCISVNIQRNENCFKKLCYKILIGSIVDVRRLRVLRRIFRPKRDEVTGGQRKLHNEELHNLYSTPNVKMIKSRRMRWTWHEARMGKIINVYNILAGKSEGKRSLARPRRRWEDTIKMDLREILLRGVDWIHLSQDRDRWRAVVNRVMSLLVP